MKAATVRFRPRAGFTLVELIVVLTIVTLITTVVLFRHRSFNSATVLTNRAYEIALSIRQMQAYGIGVRDAGGGGFQSAYGVRFDDAETEKKSYFAFKDADENGVYNDAVDGDPIETYTLGGFEIEKTCAGATDCNVPVDITFRRPNPDAIVNNLTNTEACIVVVNSDDVEQKRMVKVLPTGQISITNLSAPNPPSTCP